MGLDFNKAVGVMNSRGLASLTVPQIACLGDSNTFINWGNDSTTGTADISPPTQGILQTRGFAFWAQTLAGARVEFPQDLNFGTSGETSTQILARVADAANSRADAVVVLAGTNDRGAAALSAATTIANLSAIVTALRAKNKRVFLITVPPRGVAGTEYFAAGAQQLLYLYAVNTWIKRVASQIRGVSVIDAWADIADPTSDRGVFKAGMIVAADAAHFGPASAYPIGKLLAAEFVRIYPAIDWLPKSNYDLLDLTNNQIGVLNPNSMMAGTGGTKSGSTPTPTGNVADSWVLSGSDSGLTLAASKVTSGNDTLQRLTIGGTASQSTSTVTLEGTISQSAGKVVAGNVIEAFAKVSVGASSGLFGLALMLQETYDPGGGNVTVNTQCGDSSHVTGVFMPAEAWSGVLRLPPMTIPTGTLSSLKLRLRAWGLNGSACSAAIDVTGMGARKIIAGQ